MDGMTVQEIYDANEGFKYRCGLFVRPFALQTFLTQAMFSKDVDAAAIVKSFNRVMGLKGLKG